MIGTAIQRTRLQQAYAGKHIESDGTFHKVVNLVVRPKIAAIISGLESEKDDQNKVAEALKNTFDLQKQLTTLLREIEKTSPTLNKLNYPEMPLTKRELEVLTCIKKGLTNGQIGQQLFITERTVKFHITAILSKLNACNRTEAVNIGLKRGIFGV